MKGREIFKVDGVKITRLRRHCPKCLSTNLENKTHSHDVDSETYKCRRCSFFYELIYE